MKDYLRWLAFEPETQADPELPDIFELGDHDPILRYATLGIFVILAKAALAIARPIALPVTAGVVLGIVLGPMTDRIVRLGVPSPLAAGVVVLTVASALIGLLVLLATPLAMGIDQSCPPSSQRCAPSSTDSSTSPTSCAVRSLALKLPRLPRPLPRPPTISRHCLPSPRHRPPLPEACSSSSRPSASISPGAAR